jgi:hypothetical protein
MASVTKCLVALALLALSTTASAGQAKPIGGTAAEGACNDDVERLCKDVQPGEGRILECLKSNQKDVSKGCVQATQQLRAQLKHLLACEPDVEKLCWNVPIGKGGIARCLQTNQSNVSSDCKAAIAQAKEAKGKALSTPMEPPEQ